MIVYWLVDRPPAAAETPGMTLRLASTTASEFHHFAANAALIMSEYVVPRPVPPATAMAPGPLSSVITFWPSSGRSLSIFLPSFSQSRPFADISVPLFGGPTAWDARLALSRATAVWTHSPMPFMTRTRAPASARPNGFRPLKMLFARPSQKLRMLNTAFTTEGVLRPVTRRTLRPVTEKPFGTRIGVMLSRAAPGMMSLNCALWTPCEPPMSSMSRVTADCGSEGFDSWWNGKSAAVNAWFGPPPSNVPLWPGFIWFVVRTSAPAWKWQDAHA